MVRDAIRIRGHASGAGSPNTAAAEGLLGMVLTREHPDVRELYGWLADLEDARGQHAEAIRDRAIATVR